MKTSVGWMALVLLLVATAVAAQPAEKAPGRLGITLHPQAALPTVSEVSPGSAAESMGLAVGDVIKAIDGRPVATPQDLVEAIRPRAAGDAISLTVERAGETLELRGTLKSPPPDPSATGKPAPEWKAERWGNLPEAAAPPTVESLRGQVAVLFCFQAW